MIINITTDHFVAQSKKSELTKKGNELQKSALGLKREPE
jgi:hypothetical protein